MYKIAFTWFMLSIGILYGKLSAQKPDSLAMDMMEVGVIPIFPGCESSGNSEERLDCFNRQLGIFLAANVEYPKQARRNNKEGIVFVKFTITQTGEIEDVYNVFPDRKIGYGIEEEALRVIRMLPLMQPAMQKGKPVNFTYTVPIQFRLNLGR